MRSVPHGTSIGLSLPASNVADDLPDLFFGHAHALLRRSIRRHRRAGNSFVDGSKQVGVRIAVTLLRSRQIGPAASPARAKSVAKRTVRSKLRFTQLRGFRITCKRVLPLSMEPPRHGEEPKQCAAHPNEEGNLLAPACGARLGVRETCVHKGELLDT